MTLLQEFLFSSTKQLILKLIKYPGISLDKFFYVTVSKGIITLRLDFLGSFQVNMLNLNMQISFTCYMIWQLRETRGRAWECYIRKNETQCCAFPTSTKYFGETQIDPSSFVLPFEWNIQLRKQQDAGKLQTNIRLSDYLPGLLVSLPPSLQTC